MRKDEDYECKDCGKEMRRKAYTEECFMLKQCPQCYTKGMQKPKSRVTTEENVMEVLAEIDKVISELDGMLKSWPHDLTNAKYVNRNWGLERARLIIVSTLTFE